MRIADQKVMVHSSGLEIVGTRNVYSFVPSIPRKRSFGYCFLERNCAPYLNHSLPV